ncbi:hypothetical protein VSS74_01625 [Conexibacter stalactiti]|uniref:Uncharacterized protein n=1 Tax=Conexibacter stalactiti TaxID=1940611 RepID=A0ABU4HI84_9ACTN|nr:hypothetical protein [Conexibacter stalactiti]MDW5593018.1 hypothetical protein [Conexibacter stalactiti]MEC5033659.1 hypothetical protein [Conexibacter stalactiti]
MCGWDWATILTIAGASFELVGLGFVFIELATIRSRELHQPLPWARSLTSGGDPDAADPSSKEHGMGRVSGDSALPTVPRVRSAAEFMAFGADPVTASEMVAEDLRRAAAADATERAREVDVRAAERADQLAAEIARREAEHRAMLRTLLTRQATGAVLVLGGLILGTVGNLM